MVKRADSDWLPDVGEAVSVDWGLESVRGRVVDAYASGSRPRAVVEIEPGEVSDEGVTVTVPLEAIRPLTSHSKWAQAVRFENSVVEAVSRILGEGSFSFQKHPSISPEADLLVTLPNGRHLVIEAKKSSRRTSAKDVQRSIQQLTDYLGHEPSAIGLLVLDQEVPENWRPQISGDVLVATWRDEADDQRLSDSLHRLLDA